MRIEFASADEFPWGMFLLWTVIWVAVLGRILSRKDFDTMTKLLWTVVVIFVPFFGVFLYAFLAPAPIYSKAATDPVAGSTPETRKTGRLTPLSDVAGTPWANNPHFTND